MALAGTIALVTGASRGIGRGIALQLGQAGATVYITGRRPAQQDELVKSMKTDSLEETASEITKRGGKGVPVYCNHADPEDIKNLFKKIEKENNGKLDILVNNAFAAGTFIFKNTGKKFYELDPDYSFDIVNNVGLKNHYICSIYASRMMVPRKSGLIVTVSSTGGMGYLFNIAYGIGKAGCDRLVADMAVDLGGHKVVSVGLWPGAVRTEMVQDVILKSKYSTPTTKALFGKAESPEFSGKCIVELFKDKNLFNYTGRILTTPDLAMRYSIHDDDGSQPNMFPEKIKNYLQMLNETRNWKNAKENAKL